MDKTTRQKKGKRKLVEHNKPIKPNRHTERTLHTTTAENILF